MGRPRTYSARSIEAARKKARKGGWVLKKQPGTAYVAARAKKAAKPTRRSTTRRSTNNDGGAAMRRGRKVSRRQTQQVVYEGSATYRTFSGKRYRKWTATFNESEAKREAARVRSQFSANARVVKKRIDGRRTAYVVYRGSSRTGNN